MSTQNRSRHLLEVSVHTLRNDELVLKVGTRHIDGRFPLFKLNHT